MLQRAASNAYSWWWASHIRTKQSKWLEQNLQDMEEKVVEMIKIIDDDGDSFAQRAEMYYRKRPELINHVEDSFRSYRALAERFDQLSKELQSANRTIATAFPEQVQFAIDIEDEENRNETSTSSTHEQFKPKGNIPKVPATPSKDLRSPSMRGPRKGLKRSPRCAKTAAAPSKSGLTKNEALEEIDKLQKGILALQTEKEFAKTSYERGYETYWDIEEQIIEMQAKVCNLQDEFGIGTVIDDNEARALMAATAIKSCQESLGKLQEEQERTVREAKAEYQRILEAHEKFSNLRKKFGSKQTDQQEPLSWKIIVEQEENDVELLRKRIREELAIDPSASLTVSQLAEKVDELVEKIVNLKSSLSSLVAMVNTLRSETNRLEAHIRNLEGEKEPMISDSGDIENRLTAIEEKLRQINSLNEGVQYQNTHLQTHFTEASCNIDYLSEKLQSGKIEEDVENGGLFHEVKAMSGAKAEKEVKEQRDKLALGDSPMGTKDTQAEKEEEKDETLSPFNSVKTKDENFDYGTSDKPYVTWENIQKMNHEDKDEKKFMSETASINPDSDHEELGTEEGEEAPIWRMLSRGFEDREKILLEEYSSVLQNYKDVKRKLSEVEKRNRDGFIDLALQLRELENAVANRDEEIESLRHKLRTLSQADLHERTEGSLIESHTEGCRESITQTGVSPVSNLSSLFSDQQPPPSSKQNFDYKERSDYNKPPTGEENKVNVKHVKTPPLFSPIQEKIRSDIDELLEENLEFWLRFSTSVHQIQKYQTTVQDLKAELVKLNDTKKQEGSSKQRAIINSDARAIYKHLREIQTELSLWLENNEVLKDEVQQRHSSLSNIQEEISSVVNASGEAAVESELSNHQAAKFQGEVINMKQESSKVAYELDAGLDRVKQLKLEVEKALAKLDDEIKYQYRAPTKSSSSGRPRIPLHSFLFGVKLKKQKTKPSLFSCMNPALQKQYSDLGTARRP